MRTRENGREDQAGLATAPTRADIAIGIAGHRDTFFRPVRLIHKDDVIVLPTQQHEENQNGVVSREVLAKNFGVPESAFANIPKEELYIFESQVPGPLAADRM